MECDIQFIDEPEKNKDKNKCSECGLRGSFNYEDKDYGEMP